VEGNVDHQAMHVHNAFNGNNDKNGTERDDCFLTLISMQKDGTCNSIPHV